MDLERTQLDKVSRVVDENAAERLGEKFHLCLTQINFALKDSSIKIPKYYDIDFSFLA